MSEEQMLYCLIAFILGWLVSRHMGDGFSVGAQKCIVRPQFKKKYKKKHPGTLDSDLNMLCHLTGANSLDSDPEGLNELEKKKCMAVERDGEKACQLVDPVAKTSGEESPISKVNECTFHDNCWNSPCNEILDQPSCEANKCVWAGGIQGCTLTRREQMKQGEMCAYLKGMCERHDPDNCTGQWCCNEADNSTDCSNLGDPRHF